MLNTILSIYNSFIFTATLSIMLYKLLQSQKVNDKRFSQVVSLQKQQAETKAKEKKKDEKTNSE